MSLLLLQIAVGTLLKHNRFSVPTPLATTRRLTFHDVIVKRALEQKVASRVCEGQLCLQTNHPAVVRGRVPFPHLHINALSSIISRLGLLLTFILEGTRDERGGGEGALERKRKGRGPDVPPRDGLRTAHLRKATPTGDAAAGV